MTTGTDRATATPAGLGWRALALVYDGLLVLALLLLTSALALALHGGAAAAPGSAWAVGQWLAAWLVVGAYFVVSWCRGGQSIGMRPWRLQVLADDGKPAGWRSSCLRYLAASATPGLCLLWCLFDGRRRGLHDLAAGTVLVRRARASA
jgi:uncharacterized RDD family membrane protein YckC